MCLLLGALGYGLKQAINDRWFERNNYYLLKLSSDDCWIYLKESKGLLIHARIKIKIRNIIVILDSLTKLYKECEVIVMDCHVDFIDFYMVLHLVLVSRWCLQVCVVYWYYTSYTFCRIYMCCGWVKFFLCGRKYNNQLLEILSSGRSQVFYFIILNL